MSVYTLRDAGVHDLEFIFGVIIAVRQSEDIFNWQDEFQRFKADSVLPKCQIVQYQDRDIGRLRIVRNDGKNILVGGIQLLPAFQNKGIGSAIFADLIQESNQKEIPLWLQVYLNNDKAFRFYTRLGFVEECLLTDRRQLIRAPTV
jgi:GNAT superfamily N-acetyltransferase